MARHGERVLTALTMTAWVAIFLTTATTSAVGGLPFLYLSYVAMRRAMILAIGAYLPVAALVLRFHRLGLPGVWVALGLWLAARAALLGRRWRAQFRLTPGQGPG